MTFFLDNCIPPPIGQALRDLGADVRILREEFEKPDVHDDQWMPAVAEKGWILVTDDNRIRRSPGQRTLLKQLKLRGVFLPGGFPNLGLWVQAAKLVQWWPAIEKTCRKLKPGVCLNVTMHGRVDVIEKL